MNSGCSLTVQLKTSVKNIKISRLLFIVKLELFLSSYQNKLDNKSQN